MIAEYDNGAAVTSPSREYIYAGSQLVAKIEAGATNYFHPDHLSIRANTDSSGNVSRTFGQYPFGEVWYETGTANKWKFTSYERDAESGNDYAMARSYINRYARFSSTDPLAGSIPDPQSLNRYSYTLNDPVNLIDPSGLHWECTSSGVQGRAQGPGTCIWVPDVDASGNPINFSPFGAGGRAQLIIHCTFGFSIGTGNTICNDPNEGQKRASLKGDCIQSIFYPSCEQPKRPTCIAVAVNAAADADPLEKIGLSPLPPGIGLDDVSKATAAALVARHTIERGLVVPLRSSIVRNILLAGEVTANVFAFGPIVYQLSVGVVAEVKARNAGRCRTAWDSH